MHKGITAVSVNALTLSVSHNGMSNSVMFAWIATYQTVVQENGVKACENASE